MANCGGTHESHGTGQGATQADAQNRALSHFMATGQAVCSEQLLAAEYLQIRYHGGAV